MQIYLVGGAVRDALLGLPVQDRDWVVVGSTPEELVERGFVPVGKDFPVFLHPQTREEYALARTERKTARGYRGFAVHAEPDVTLEQDLARRDLTINSIAAPARPDWATGRSDSDMARLTDPFDGQGDLRRKILRHVTAAFREDPVRILRVARFGARFSDFHVAPETLALMRQMVADGEADALVAERVWQELSRGLMEAAPSRMLEILRDCGALQALLPELMPATGDSPARSIVDEPFDVASAVGPACDEAARMGLPLPVRFACLCLGAASLSALSTLCVRWRVPNECRELAELVRREHAAIDAAGSLDAEACVGLLERSDAFRKPQRFAQALLTCECAARTGTRRAADLSSLREPYKRLAAVLSAAQSVATDEVAACALADGQNGAGIGAAIHASRVRAVARTATFGPPPPV